MFGDRDKVLIHKFLAIQIAGKNGNMIPAGTVYIKHTVQFLTTTDQKARDKIWQKMSAEFDDLVPYVTAGEVKDLNVLLREACEQYTAQEVSATIATLRRKRSSKRGAAEVAV